MEIVLTNLSGRISGRVNNAQGQAVPGYVALVFATERDRSDQNRAPSGSPARESTGRSPWVISPQESAFVAAVDWMRGNDTSGEWLDPDFLQSTASRATRVTSVKGNN